MKWNNDKISKERIQDILLNYNNGLNLKEVSRKLDICVATCSRYIRENNIHIRKENKNNKKWTADDNYFKIIDNQDKAYFLGFIYADGNIFIDESNHKSVFNINLKEEDGYMLEKFKELLKLNKPLRLKKYPKMPNASNAIILDYADKEFCQNLVNLGCIPRKSLVLTFPNAKQVPNHLISHFVRGYFDGDGSVGMYDNCKRCNIVSTYSFLDSLQSILNIYNIKSKIQKVTKCWGRLVFSSKRDNLDRFYNYIYKDANLFLIRKKEIFDKIYV